MIKQNKSGLESRTGLVALGAILLFSVGLSDTGVAEAQGAAADDPAYAHAQQLIDVGGGRRMNLYCIGKGSPTVVFEAGLSSWSMVWAKVQPQIAKFTRACAYDRSGLGFSDPTARPATAANIVDDLHRLLLAAGIEAPYVLVGHSIGGLYVRVFADRYRADVTGMVLVDPVVEGEMLWDAAAAGQPDARMSGRLERFRKCDAEIRRLPHGFTPGSAQYQDCVDAPDPHFGPGLNAAAAKIENGIAFQDAQLSEFSAGYSGVSFNQALAGQIFYGDMPLVVLSKIPDPATLPPAQRTPENAVLWELHEQLSALALHGQHRGIANTEHEIQLHRPEVVIEAVRDVIAAPHRDSGARLKADQ